MRRLVCNDGVSLRTPELAQLFNTLRKRLSAVTRDDLETLLTTGKPTDGTSDEVKLALPAADKGTELLYEINKYAEDIGVASKATFSRSRTNLGETQIIVTEKIPVGVGWLCLRPLFGGKNYKTPPPGNSLATYSNSTTDHRLTQLCV